MKIETYWEDVTVYRVGFHVETSTGKKLYLQRVLVVPNVKIGNIEYIISAKFSNVIKVEYIDLFDEYALLLK